MPILIKTIDQIMDHEKRDLTLFSLARILSTSRRSGMLPRFGSTSNGSKQENYHMRLPLPAVGYGAIRDAVWSILTDPMILGSRSIQASSRTRQVEA